jgi:hypothetical protein
MVMGADEPVESILREGRIGVALRDVVDGHDPRPLAQTPASLTGQAA